MPSCAPIGNRRWAGKQPAAGCHPAPHSRDIWKQKLPRLPCRARDGLSRQVSTSHRTFHGGWPTAARPIASQEEIRDFTRARRAQLLKAGLGGKRGAHFLHHVRLLDFGFARAGKKLPQFPNGYGDYIIGSE